MTAEIDGDASAAADEVVGLSTVGSHRYPRRKQQRVPTPRWMNATTSQGVSRPQEEMDFLPFSQVLLTDDGGSLNGILIARPQRPFRGERLVMSAIDAAADAGNAIVIDPAIYVGAVQVGASQGSTPISTFSARAFGVRLSLPAAGQGTEIKIFVRALVPPVSANYIVTAVLIGRAMR